MPWLEFAFEVPASQAEQYSDAAENIGAVSVSYFPASERPVLEPKPNTMPLWEKVKVVALFEQNHNPQKIKNALQKQFPKLVIAHTVLADQQWELTWQAHFKPMCFGERLWIVPTDSTIPAEAKTVVRIAPGLGFGTGNHTTTALCLRWLDQADLNNKTITDYGCGSGILSLAAIQLGAQYVYAIDYDEQALQATAANAHLNALGENKLHVLSPEKFNQQTDIVIANILAPILIELAPTLRTHLLPQGQIVLAGLLSSQIEMVLSAYKAYFNFEKPIISEEWALLIGRLKPV